MNRRFLFSLIWIPLVAVSALGQAGSPPLTMDRIVSLYLEHNLELQAARYRLERTKADQIAARRRPNPALSITAENLRLSGPVIAGGLYEIGAAYSETIELGGKRAARERVADAAVSVAEARFSDAIRQGIA